jgi:hypothetical protein
MESKQTRLANLRQLIKREGAVSQLALRLQISPIYIYRVLDGKFNIGDSMARKIEDAYGYPGGWMDAYHGGGEHEDTALPTLEVAVRSPLVQQPIIPEPLLTPPEPPEPPQRAAEEAAAAVSLAEASHTADDASKARLISQLIAALDRVLASNGTQMTDLEKARLLMKAAETILDSGTGSRPTSSPSRPVLKVSGPG